MADSIRMMDLGALSRSLELLRGIDPEERVLAQRAAVRAAVKHVEEVHHDVLESERAAEARVDEHLSERNRRRARQLPPEGDGAEGKEAEAVPEADEGHLLDIKV